MPVYKSADKTADGRQWYFQVSQSHGYSGKKYKSKRYATKKEAEKALALFLLAENQPVKPLTFEMLTEEYLADKKQTLKPQSWLRVRVLSGHICDRLANVCVATMDKPTFERFYASVAENASWSISYKNKVINFLKTLLLYAYNKHDISNRIPYKYPPFKDTQAPHKVMKFFTKQEFDRFIEAVDDLRYKTLFSVLFYCGLRIGEANALQWSDVTDVLSITKTVSTKIQDKDGNYLITSPKTAGSVRTVPYPAKVGALLAELHDHFSKYDHFNDGWYVFGGLRPLPETTITKAKDRFIKKAGVKSIRIHDFRHSTASYYAHLGASPVILSRLLGHSSAKMTLDTYSHFYTSDLKELVAMAD